MAAAEAETHCNIKPEAQDEEEKEEEGSAVMWEQAPPTQSKRLGE